MKKIPKITVIGSINMDMVTVTDKVPVQGETLVGERFETVPGGKGANQAVAAARLGADVQFIGRVGEDAFGFELKKELEKEGISIANVEPVTHVSSGVATIILSDSDNRIIVVPGANDYVTPDYIEKFKEEIISSDLVLLQFEIPLETVRFCLDLCFENNIPVILNPAPAKELSREDWEKASFITPNETEATLLFSNSQKEIDQELLSKLIITKGDQGAKYTEDGTSQTVPSFKVNPTDTTGAGDTFNGALAVAVAENKSLHEAVQFANGAAALSVQRFGAQGGMPTRDELENFLNSKGERG